MHRAGGAHASGRHRENRLRAMLSGTKNAVATDDATRRGAARVMRLQGPREACEGTQ